MDFLVLQLFMVSFLFKSTASGFPDVIKNPYYKKPLSLISPDDMRGPQGQKISGLYTLVAPKQKWPNAIVYWEYDSTNNFTAEEKAIIEKGLKEIQNETCISFKPKTDQTAFLSFKNDAAGCWATAGYQGAKQSANMAKDCFGDTSTLIHEVMHALGFHHEQTRYDRDMYVEVQWSNIETGKEGNFAKYPRTMAFPKYLFDFTSIMQYTLDGFAIDGRPTMILTIQNDTLEVNNIGKATKMSKTDILRMRSAYRCDYHGEGAARPDKTRFKKKKKYNKYPRHNLVDENSLRVADLTFY